MHEGGQYVTVNEARARLRVSKWKMADLLKRGVFSTREDPLDRRVKLIRRADVDAYLQSVPRPREDEDSEKKLVA